MRKCLKKFVAKCLKVKSRLPAIFAWQQEALGNSSRRLSEMFDVGDLEERARKFTKEDGAIDVGRVSHNQF
jgi:hypothetical protein